jgi:hypothetical protein
LLETAIYVLIGVLTTALLALLALPAISRRAFRLAERRARLSAPLSAAEALADRDALRGRHAVEIALSDRRADTAQEKWAAAQITLGERAADIVRRDAEIEDKAQEIARQRAELAALAREVGLRDVEIGARETALRDFEGQRDAAEHRFTQTTAELKQTQSEAAKTRASLEQRIEDLSRELSLTQHRGDSALFAAKATIADFERRLEESEAEALKLRRRAADLADRLAAPAPGGDSEAEEPEYIHFPGARPFAEPPADASERERELSVRLAALTAALSEAEAATRGARTDRLEAERESDRLRALAAASEAKAERLSEADDSLRQAIIRLGRELVAGGPAQALVDSQREPAS